jgi:hypothetical protein
MSSLYTLKDQKVHDLAKAKIFELRTFFMISIDFLERNPPLPKTHAPDPA